MSNENILRIAFPSEMCRANNQSGDLFGAQSTQKENGSIDMDTLMYVEKCFLLTKASYLQIPNSFHNPTCIERYTCLRMELWWRAGCLVLFMSLYKIRGNYALDVNKVM